MARISKKEKERRKRISEALKAFHAEEKRKAKRRSIAAKKGAATRKRQKEEKVKPTYHKPVKTKPKPKRKKVKPTYHKPAKPPSPPPTPKRKPEPRKRKPRPEILPPSDISQIPERQKKGVKRKPKVKEVILIEEEAPKKKESFVDEAKHEGKDTWKGPWREGPPTTMEAQYAVAEIIRISEAVADGIASEKVQEENELKHPVNAWALSPVINSDKTVSGEVRFEIPKGVDYMSIVQRLQELLPSSDFGNLWITPVVDYVPRQSDVEGGFDALSNSPFEPVRGGAFIRAFSIKYDDRIGIKAVTGFAKAQEMADKIDPQQRFIRPTTVRIKIRWSERPPRSSYEIRKMEEKKAAAEAKRRFMEGEGFEPIN